MVARADADWASRWAGLTSEDGGEGAQGGSIGIKVVYLLEGHDE